MLQRIALQHFRNYETYSLTFDPSVTLLVGANAIGKTNILEAIFIASTGKSFRADHERDVISWGSEIGRVAVQLEEDRLEVMITSGLVNGEKAPRKKVLVNGVARRVLDFVGKLPTVLFRPEDVSLVTDSPSIRRKYLDSVLSLVDREYHRSITAYEKGIRRRNKLLFLIHEGEATREQLFYWNELLIKTGSYITEARSRFLDFVNTYHVPSREFQIIYDKSVISEARLLQYKDEEIAAKTTLVGPHRDDIQFEMKRGDRETMRQGDSETISKRSGSQAQENLNVSFVSLASFGSRGEQRLGVLWIKLAEIQFVEQRLGKKPILLLDDIFSELDIDHQKVVLDVIPEYQSVITSADFESVALVKQKTAGECLVVELGVQ